MAGSRRARDARLEQDVGVAEGEVAVELEQEVGGAIAVDVPCHNRVLARLPVAQLAAGSGELAAAEPGEGLIVRKVLAGIDGLQVDAVQTWLEVPDHVALPAPPPALSWCGEDEAIGIGSSVQAVPAQAAGEPVLAALAEEAVVARLALPGVSSSAADQQVLA